MFRRFAEYYDAFNAIVDPRVANWRSKPFLPIIAQQIWSLVAKFSSLRPGFEVRIRGEDLADEALEEKASKAQKKLEYDYDCPLMEEPMRDKLAAAMIDTGVTGTGIGKVPWRTKTVTRYERMVDDVGMADLTKEKKIEKFTGFNDFEPVNIFNVFPSPTTDKLNKGWLVLRSYEPLSELEATNDAKGGNFYKNLDKLSGAPKYGEFATLNASRNRLLTEEEQHDPTTDIATLYECYEGNDIYVYGEDKSAKGEGGWVLLRKTKNFYWHGKWPVVKFVIKKRPFSFWGQGLAELTYRLQVIYNDIFAHFLDATSLVNNPSFWVNEDQDVNNYVVEPGALLTYTGQKPPEPIKFNLPDAGALEMVIGIINQSIEGVTASSYATGMTNSNQDKTKGTATGILKLQEAAGDIVGYMRENFASSILQIGKMWHSNNQQFLQEPVNITISDKGKRENVRVSPADLQGEAEIYIDSASMNPPSEEEKAAKTLGFVQQLQGLRQLSLEQEMASGTDPLVLNVPEIADEVGDGFGYENTQKFLLSQDQIKKMLIEKGEKMAEEAALEDQGLDTDPNQASMQMTEGLINEGHIDPEELERISAGDRQTVPS